MSSGQRWEMKNVRLSALGAHQQENALTAVSTVLSLRHQGWNIPDSSIRAGLEATVIPGRFQILDQHKAQALGFSNARVILDGGMLHLAPAHIHINYMQRL
jgi:folylpolyglutamate synthase/dihydropteroate synthase